MTNTKNTKRALLSSVLALLVCFAMLIGTTYAWFTDSVTSGNNIIQTGDLKVGFQWANGTEDPANANWTDVSGALFDYANWEPGYTVAKHLKVSNEGTLALNYQMRIVTDGVLTKLADVIDVYCFDNAQALSRNDLANATYLGTFAEIVGTQKNISNTVKGSLKPGDPAQTYTIIFKMNENADSTYESLDLGCDFTVELVATQMAYESDIFGTDYDDVALSDAVPPARVRSIDAKDTVTFTRESGEVVTIVGEGLAINATAGIGGAAESINLDAIYKFEPSQTFEELQLSEYKYYLADFIISADKDVPADSLALAGYYDAWCSLNNDNWVALSSPDDITAGTEIRLVEAMGAAVHYKDICQYGNDGLGFMCGVVDLTGENAGTTITVKLCLFETTADPNGSSANTEETGSAPVEIGTFTYTFPKVVNTENGLADALAEGGTITLAAGEYKMPSNQAATGDLTIVGTKDTVVDVTLGAYMDGANVAFEGVTIKTSTGYVNGNGSDYAALYTPNVTYTDCTFVGPMKVGRDGAKFINCTFTQLGNDYIWTYGNDVTFEGCTFNTDGKAILVYSDGGNEVANVTVKNCTFNSTQGAKAGAINNQNCAAIEIHNYGNGVNLVTEGNTYDANFSGEWRIKTYEAGRPQVIVNGVEYTDEALDGTILNVVNGAVQP